MTEWMIHTSDDTEVFYRAKDVDCVRSKISNEDPYIRNTEIHFRTGLAIELKHSIQEYNKLKQVLIEGKRDD